MPFCPMCRDEFEDRIEVCPDCNIALAEKLPALSEPDKKTDEPLVQIATAPNEPIAIMWAGVLEEYDIHSLLKGVQLGGMSIYTPTFEMLHRVYVLESEADRAKELLAPFLNEL
ncbi:hypothetical protein ACFLUP_02865 [Chloroflexota bacterium]